jgi:hypothetical protein
VAERVPAGDHGLRAGDRIFGMARTHGSYAEYTAVVPVLDLVNGPDTIRRDAEVIRPGDAWSRPSSRPTKAGLPTARSPRTTTPPARIP